MAQSAKWDSRGAHCSPGIKRMRNLFSHAFLFRRSALISRTGARTKGRLDRKDCHEDSSDKSKTRGESGKFLHCFATESHLKVKGASLKKTSSFSELSLSPSHSRGTDIRVNAVIEAVVARSRDSSCLILFKSHGFYNRFSIGSIKIVKYLYGRIPVNIASWN